MFQQLGIYLVSKGVITPVAVPGTPMPGGGKFVSASFFVSGEVHVNNGREVVFSAILDFDTNGVGRPDTDSEQRRERGSKRPAHRDLLTSSKHRAGKG